MSEESWKQLVDTLNKNIDFMRADIIKHEKQVLIQGRVISDLAGKLGYTQDDLKKAFERADMPF